MKLKPIEFKKVAWYHLSVKVSAWSFSQGLFCTSNQPFISNVFLITVNFSNPVTFY